MAEIKLEPCPLCGAPASIVETSSRAYINRAVIRCTGCGLELNHTQYFYFDESRSTTGALLSSVKVPVNESPEDAWNRRYVKPAEWKHLGGDEWCCTACGRVIHTEGSWEKPGKKYCEECGAKMKLEETP